MKPYPDQEKAVNEIITTLKQKSRLLYQLPTGGGKTAIFSFLAKQWYLETNKKVLIVVHRDILVKQSAKTLRLIGMSVETVVKEKKKLHHNCTSYVAMVETLNNRLNVDPDFVKDIDLIICDEAHLLLFEKIFKHFPDVKICAFSGTPSVDKKVSFCQCSRCGNISDTIDICCNVEMFEYSRKFTLSEIYENIIIGTSISDLIEIGRLIKPIYYDFGKVHHKDLKIDAKTNDYDDEEFSGSEAVANVVLQYEKLLKNEKTLIFNSSTKTNLSVYNQFVNAGYTNVKLLDSVNECEKQPDILEWFKNTPDAILLNCGILTTGFDEPTLQGIILNRATKSITLYHQMVGRVGRPCDYIFKPFAKVVDLAGNIEAHGKWEDFVDWEAYFFGTNDKPRPKKEALENVIQCKECGSIISKSLLVCPECGFEKFGFKKQEQLSSLVAVLVDDYPIPDGYKIVKYTKKNEKDLAFAYTILINSVVDLFIYRYVTKGSYEKSLTNGKFHDSLKSILSKPMKTFAVSFERKNMRTFENLLKTIKQKLDSYYKITEPIPIKIITIL
jgi:superfamily II DNA or RNA helicase